MKVVRGAKLYQLLTVFGKRDCRQPQSPQTILLGDTSRRRSHRISPAWIGVVACGTIVGLVLKWRASTTRKALQRELQPKSVWIINHYAIAPDMTGGIRHYELASELSGRGWQPTVIASPFNYQQGRFERPVSRGKWVERRAESGVEFVWLYSMPYRRNDLRRYVNMVSFLVTCVYAGVREPAPSIVIGSSPHPLAALGGWMLATWHRVPFVLEIRDLWPDTLIDMGLSNPLIIRPLQVLEKFLYVRAARIIVLAESFERAISQKGIDPSRLVFIPNAVMRSIDAGGDRSTLRRSLGWDGKVVFIYAGAHGAANALDVVVDAARELRDEPNIMIALLGDGPEKLHLKELADGLDNIEFLDPVPKEHVYPFLRAADVGVINLGSSEVFKGVRPNKLFDYLASGLPILTTVPGETWGVVHQAGAGLFAEPGDSGALACRMRELARDPDLRQRLADNARKHAALIPTREATAVDLDRMLTELLETKPAIGATEGAQRV